MFRTIMVIVVSLFSLVSYAKNVDPNLSCSIYDSEMNFLGAVDEQTNTIYYLLFKL